MFRLEVRIVQHMREERGIPVLYMLVAAIIYVRVASRNRTLAHIRHFEKMAVKLA